ncbi:MAG: efflux RND transporter periplasmic adaptor subunit [Sulfurimonadaceae bacterium]
MKHYFLSVSFLLLINLNAGDLIKAGSLNVTLASPKKVEKVPVGSYLGTYTYPAAHRFTISAYVDGFVSEIAVKPYAMVKKGQKLFVLQSPKLLDLQSDYIATLIELEFHQKEIARLKPLSEKGVVASKRYTEAKNMYDQLKASIVFKQSLLKAYGLSQTQINKVTAQHKAYPSLVISAPENATVSSLDVQVGTFIHQGATLAKLVDTTECHFEIDLPWQLAATLTQDDKLYSQESTFSIFAMSPEIDPVSQTRSIDLHEEKDCKAQGGASVNVTFYRKTEAWVVPSSAVIGMDNGYAVFVAAEGGYRSVPVTVLAQLEGKNFISAPFTDDDRIAVSSVLTLKSAAEGLAE